MLKNNEKNFNPNISLFDISVIIPSYNSERTIVSCVESVINALPIKKEIILVDDGSIDRTSELISHYPVRLFRMAKNSGCAAAKNKGAALSTGKIIFFVDSDTIVEKNFFLELLEALKNGRVGAVGGIMLPFDDGIVSFSFAVRFFESFPLTETKTREIPSTPGGGSAYPRKLFEVMKGFDETIGSCEDRDLNDRIRNAGYRILLVPSAKLYHCHPTSLKVVVKKWFLYGKYFFKQNKKNKSKKEITFVLGWAFSCILLLSIAISSGNIFFWLLSLLDFSFPWLLFYSKPTFIVWSQQRKIKYLAIPIIHQLVILSRTCGILYAAVKNLFGKKL